MRSRQRQSGGEDFWFTSSGFPSRAAHPCGLMALIWDGEVPADEPGRSVFLYNANVRPDYRADLILELPGEFD
jgi:hypothetical protein